MARFNDKVAVVTGASKGIGAGVAKRLAAEGGSVVVNYGSSKDDAERMVDVSRALAGRRSPWARV
jgi:3-oxoacyl-[acyl-carrier protein] reductase